jgi:hypothetical protein
LIRLSAVVISSTIPSAKYSCSGSPLMFSNGSTAIVLWEWKGCTQLLDRRATRSRAYRVRADRLGDVLELLLAAILEANGQLAFDFAVHLLGNQDAARICDPFQPDRNVDPVAVEFTVLPNDDVTKRNLKGLLPEAR